MNFTVEHLGLAAHNPVTLKDWYVKTLDAKVVFDNGETPPAFFLSLPGGLLLEIYRSDLALKETGINSLAGWRHVALQVDSLEITRAMLEKRGVTFTEQFKPAGGGGSVLYFSDAEGNLLHLVERPAGSPFLVQA
jgi:catechol 2,3-dioxygenase-like lactoylglutathione lyase family enzyme